MKHPSSFPGYFKLTAAVVIPIVAVLLCRSNVRTRLGEWGEEGRCYWLVITGQHAEAEKAYGDVVRREIPIYRHPFPSTQP